MYVSRATRTGGRRHRRPSGSLSDSSPKQIRAWAHSQGLTVPERGRIPVSVMEKYETAH